MLEPTYDYGFGHKVNFVGHKMKSIGHNYAAALVIK